MTCLHAQSVRAGKLRSGAQRFRCNDCGRTFSRSNLAMPGIYLKPDRIADLREMYLAGLAMNHAARVTGTAPMTVSKLYKRFRAIHGAVTCPCGGPSGHRGWCAWRYKYSEKRRAVVEGFHQKRTA